MNSRATRTQWMLWIGLLLVVATLALAFLLTRLPSRVPAPRPLPVYGAVTPFHLTNQLGQAITLDDLRGRVWIVDIIFTRCAGPCLKMSRQMRDLQNSLPGEKVRFVTLTTDPEYDTPPILKTYGERFSADPRRWWFLTGPKEQIRDLETRSLKLTALEKKPSEQETPEDLFIHSTQFLLIDKHGQCRAVFNTTGEGIDFAQVKSELIAAVASLEREQ